MADVYLIPNCHHSGVQNISFAVAFFSGPLRQLSNAVDRSKPTNNRPKITLDDTIYSVTTNNAENLPGENIPIKPTDFFAGILAAD